MKNIIILISTLFVFIFNSCNSEKKEQVLSGVKSINGSLTTTLKDSLQGFYKSDRNIFSGDSILAMKNYFEHLTDDDKGYLILKKQNESYQNHYANFINTDSLQFSSNNIQFKLEKQFLSNEKNYRIVLYTLIDNKKRDSIEFYRNVNDLRYEPGSYTSLSYLDLKNKKIWQIKYFSSRVDKSVGYILYAKNKVMENGKIETDSLYYLDESLDVEMEKENLYY